LCHSERLRESRKYFFFKIERKVLGSKIIYLRNVSGNAFENDTRTFILKDNLFSATEEYILFEE
ncbi:MAG TPA: hypothetical protein PK455_07115, partial [Caldisericia bacterium]|nr:hypothetical protein [Caldisericia bacterium]